MSELAAALVAALPKLETVDKNKEANVGKYSYGYADIADVVKATRSVLAEHGLVALTPVHEHEQGLACSVELVHSSGEVKVFAPLPFRAGADAQATGSAITYHRRYALLAALGMAADDDDGAAATEAARRQPARQASSQSSDKPSGGEPKAASDKQVAFARKLAAELGDAALTVVPSIVLEETGREAKLHELTMDEISPVIEQLKAEASKVKKSRAADREAKAESIPALVAAGEEPFGAVDHADYSEAPFV